MPEASRHARARGGLWLILTIGLALAAGLLARGPLVAEADSPRRIEPGAWGSDHVGKPVPEYVSGDECLFCHRLDVGPTWDENRHNRNVREAEPGSTALAALGQAPGMKELAAEVTLIMGEERRVRFLKPSERYGKLDLLSVGWVPPREEKEGTLISRERPQWEPSTFADSCAGCHATGVDPRSRTFFARSLDCGVCHGEVPAEHSKNAAMVFLGPRRKDHARVVTSACAQCHVRTGTSRSTGLPYPNTFVPGDNVFRDFHVDLDDASIGRLNPGDAHVLENVRDVAVLGKDDVTCLSCHDVHKTSTAKHQRLPRGAACLRCHEANGPKWTLTTYEVHSPTCRY